MEVRALGAAIAKAIRLAENLTYEGKKKLNVGVAEYKRLISEPIRIEESDTVMVIIQLKRLEKRREGSKKEDKREERTSDRREDRREDTREQRGGRRDDRDREDRQRRSGERDRGYEKNERQ